MPRTRRLTDKQKAFAREYVIDGDASKAARRSGYSEKTAAAQGFELLRNPLVKAEIARLTDAKVERASIAADEIVEQLANIVRADITDVVSWGMAEVEDDEGLPVTMPDGTPVLRPHITVINSDRLDRAVTTGIAEVSMTDKGTFKVKMHDKAAAIEKLMRHLGMFEKDNKQVADGLTQLIEAVQGTTLPLAPRSRPMTAPVGRNG